MDEPSKVEQIDQREDWKLVIDNLNDLVAIINVSTLSFQPSLQQSIHPTSTKKHFMDFIIHYYRFESINQSEMHS